MEKIFSLKEQDALKFIADNNIQVSGFTKIYIETGKEELDIFNIKGFSKVDFVYVFKQNGDCDYIIDNTFPVLTVNGNVYDICKTYECMDKKYSLRVFIDNWKIRRRLLDYNYLVELEDWKHPEYIDVANKKNITEWVEYATARHNILMGAYTEALEKNKNTYKAFVEKYPDLRAEQNDFDGWVKIMRFNKQS